MNDAEFAVSSPPWPATEIVPGLWQSGHPQPGEHWDVVIDLDGSMLPLEGVALYVHWPIRDGPDAPDAGVLRSLAELVNQLRRCKKRVLVHCAGGINRSGLLAAAALVCEGVPPEQAIQTVRARRPGSLANPAFVRHLLGEARSAS